MLAQTSKAIKNQKGLTLIELLAVVVILGIIAAIAIPLIGNIISDTRDKAVASEALSVISAAKLAQATGNMGTGEGSAEGNWLPDDLEDFVDADLDWKSVSWSQGAEYTITLTEGEGNTFPAKLVSTTSATTTSATELNLSNFSQGIAEVEEG